MRASWVAWTLVLAGCASETAVLPSVASEAVVPTDHLGLALEASGYSPDEVEVARQRFDGFVFPWTRDLAGIRFPEKKAKALLTRLHGPSSPLKHYDARATSLRDIFEEGRYNCVSASVLYNLAAERIGVDAIGELLPTHARSLVRVPGMPRPLVVETTSPVGFDPPPEVSERILAQVAAGFAEGDARALVPEGGVQVATRVLIAAILVNRASIEQERGDIQNAAALFEQGESLAPDDAMQAVLRDQRVALVSQLAAADALSEDPVRLDRGFKTMSGSLDLQPSDPEIQRVVSRNFRVVAERYLAQLATQGQEKQVLEQLESLSRRSALARDRAALRAFTLGEVARARSTRGESEAALGAMDAALAEPLTEREVALRATLEHNHWQLLRRALADAAKLGDEPRVEKLLQRAESVSARADGRRTELEQDRRVVLSLLGQRKLEAGDARGAAQILREGVRRYGGDATLRHNLLVALQRLWVPLADEGRCEDAEALWDEAARAEPESPLPSQSRARCYLVKANQRIQARDLEEAATWLALAAKETPGTKTLDENLGSLLVQWAEKSRAACPRIVESAKQIFTRDPSATARARAEAAMTRCESAR